MRKLILTSGNGAREFPVGKGVTIGRNGANTIQLEGQKVEDNHAKVAPKGNLLFIEDLDTPYGILVNGKKVTRWSLNKGDVIEIGGATLRYEEDDKPEPAPAKPAAPATKPAVAAASKADAKGSAAQVKPAVKPAPAAKSSQSVLPSVPRGPATGPKSEVKIVPPAAQTARPGSGLRPAVKDTPGEKTTSRRMAVPNSAQASKGPSQQPHTNSSVHIKLSAEAKALSGSIPGDADPKSNPRSSLSRISLAGHVLDDSASRKSGGTISGVTSAVGSGRLAAPGASGKHASPGASGRFASPGSSGRMIALDQAKDLQKKALQSAKSSAREDKLLVKPLSRRTKMIAGVTALVISLGIGVALVYPALHNLSTRSSAEAEAKKVVDDAVERLRQSGPKNRKDLATAIPRLKAARIWPDVESLLGQPDMTVKDKIQLYSSDSGVYEMPGNTFKAYYVEDPLYPNPKEGDKAPILLFLINAQDRVSYVEGDRILARSANLPAEKPAAGPNVDPEKPATDGNPDYKPPPTPPPVIKEEGAALPAEAPKPQGP